MCLDNVLEGELLLCEPAGTASHLATEGWVVEEHLQLVCQSLAVLDWNEEACLAVNHGIPASC